MLILICKPAYKISSGIWSGYTNTNETCKLGVGVAIKIEIN